MFRKDGYVDTRYPISVSPTLDRVKGDATVFEESQSRTINVELRTPQEIPPGFIYVPAGPAAIGGDPPAFQSLPHNDAELPGYLIGRFEVTSKEYLEFLNDPDVLARTNEKGEYEAQSEFARSLQVDRVRIVPWSLRYGRPIWEEDVEGLRQLPRGWNEDWPALSLAHLAAREYAHWLSSKDPNWNYRLPTDREWEKAARGEDRRIYVWGNYMVWTYCWSAYAAPPETGRNVVGFVPIDESPYGVRDMAGSAEEHTAGQPKLGDAEFWSLRGGHWKCVDEYYFRAANRNGRAGQHYRRRYRLPPGRVSPLRSSKRPVDFFKESCAGIPAVRLGIEVPTTLSTPA